MWTVEGEGFKVCKEGFNHPVLYEHLVELPLDLAESISESIPGLGCGRVRLDPGHLPGGVFVGGCLVLSHAAFY